MLDALVTQVKSLNSNLLSVIKKIDQVTTYQPEILPFESAMRMLNCSRATLDRLRLDGIITAYRLKGKLYFKYSEIKAAIEANVVPNTPEQLAQEEEWERLCQNEENLSKALQPA